MYPIKFENLYYEKIWGGRDFNIFRDNLPEGNIGESWDLACHPHGVSVVKNGSCKGMRLDELINKEKEKLVGTAISTDWFPLLIKLINSKDSLSVQVHPDDEYARINEGEMGKTEVWYVVEAFEGANLIVGTKDCTREQFANALEKGSLEKYVNEVNVKKGDIFFVKSGLIHAIGKGVIIAEIQQNSDVTYRVYDYNRGRELHVKKAMDVIDFSLKGEAAAGTKVQKNGYSVTYACICKDFALEVYELQEKCTERSDFERFYAFTIVEGRGKIIYNKGEEELLKGETILIPAALGEYTLEGQMKLIKSYVPSKQKL